jgi:5-methylcytosine-specific restriction endonuclease McrA
MLENEKNKEEWICETCGSVFHKRHALIGHKRIHSKIVKQKTEKRKEERKARQESIEHRICQYCDKEFKTKMARVGHLARCLKSPKKTIRDLRRNEKVSLEYTPESWLRYTHGCMREALFLEQGESCFKCKLKTWLGQQITLEIEHIDGNNSNNNRENLQLLCPNCHSQTSTWRGRNKNKGKSGKRVQDEVLTQALRETQTIRQALQKVGLTPKSSNYTRAKLLLLSLDSQSSERAF